MGKKRVIIKKGKNISGDISTQIVSTISKKKIKEGKIYIGCSYNNTIITLTDNSGNVLYTASSGAIGFNGARKSTPFAASKVSDTVSSVAKKAGIVEVEVFVKGVGSGRDSALRSIASNELEITFIKDITPIPHNGCRRKKPKRN
jgi:small subunit ribosomal protein S11